MAVDSQEKRINAAHAGSPFMRGKFPVGATDEQSRIASGHGYGGNALSVVVPQPFKRGKVWDATYKPVHDAAYKPIQAKPEYKPAHGRAA